MRDFKPGDEVVCVDASDCPELIQGASYVVERFLAEGEIFVDLAGNRVSCLEGSAVWLLGGADFRNPDHDSAGYRPTRFSKVQRRDLSAWLETAATDTDHLDKPIKTPVRPKVDALLKRVQSGEFG